MWGNDVPFGDLEDGWKEPAVRLMLTITGLMLQAFAWLRRCQVEVAEHILDEVFRARDPDGLRTGAVSGALYRADS